MLSDFSSQWCWIAKLRSKQNACLVEEKMCLKTLFTVIPILNMITKVRPILVMSVNIICVWQVIDINGLDLDHCEKKFGKGLQPD